MEDESIMYGDVEATYEILYNCSYIPSHRSSPPVLPYQFKICL